MIFRIHTTGSSRVVLATLVVLGWCTPGVLETVTAQARLGPASESKDPVHQRVAKLVSDRGGRMVVTAGPAGQSLVSLGLGGSQVSDADLESLLAIPGLTRLDLSASLVTDRCLSHLASHATLVSLDLSRTTSILGQIKQRVGLEQRDDLHHP